MDMIPVLSLDMKMALLKFIFIMDMLIVIPIAVKNYFHNS